MGLIKLVTTYAIITIVIMSIVTFFIYPGRLTAIKNDININTPDIFKDTIFQSLDKNKIFETPENYIGENITIYGRIYEDILFYKECHKNNNLYYMKINNERLYICTEKTFRYGDSATITGKLKNITIPFPKKQILMVEDEE